MLTIVVPGGEVFDDGSSEFSQFVDVELTLEHSLVSLSKWESKFEKPFLGSDSKTPDEILWYVGAMILTPDYPKDVLNRLSHENLSEINAYVESKHSATTFGTMPEYKTRGRAEIITSELIYYWMIAFAIPFVVETWHLNRLIQM